MASSPKRKQENDQSETNSKKVKTSNEGTNSNVPGGFSDLALPRSSTDLSSKSTVPLALPISKMSKQSKTAGNASTTNVSQQQKQSDPNKMQDVLFSAGVDIREEEALLNSSIIASKNKINTMDVRIPSHPPFLHPDQVARFMQRVAKEQQRRTRQDFSKYPELLSMMSTACETYMRDILTNALVISRHRLSLIHI